MLTTADRLAPFVVTDYGYGKISADFGSTNLDNIPSTGGTGGYSRLSPPSALKPEPGLPQWTGTAPQQSGSGGDAGQPTGGDGSMLDKLIALYRSQFGAGSAASTSGAPVVIVPDPATQSGGGGISPAVIGVVVIGAVGYAAWRYYR